MKFQDEKPGDRRGFVHKTLLKGISKIAGVLPIPGAQIISTVTRGLAGSGGGGGGAARGGGFWQNAAIGKTSNQPGPPNPPPREGLDRDWVWVSSSGARTKTERPSVFSEAEKLLGKDFKFPELATSFLQGGRGAAGNGGDGCVFPWRRDPGTGECKIFVGERAGPNGGAPVGDAVMGRYGAALQPGIMTIDRSVCLKGMQLGNDGLCYNKAQISNKERMWPRGRRPLLSGGEMRAIGIAAGAGRRLERTTKRLQRIGLMKKPASRRIARGHHHHPALAIPVHHD